MLYCPQSGTQGPKPSRKVRCSLCAMPRTCQVQGEAQHQGATIRITLLASLTSDVPVSVMGQEEASTGPHQCRADLTRVRDVALLTASPVTIGPGSGGHFVFCAYGTFHFILPHCKCSVATCSGWLQHWTASVYTLFKNTGSEKARDLLKVT